MSTVKSQKGEDPFAGRILRIQKFSELYPDSKLGEPRMRASALGHSAVQQHDVYRLIRESSEKYLYTDFSLNASLLPTMHLTIELLAKALAFECDTAFSPKKYSHKTWQIFDDYRNNDAAFESAANNPEQMELIQELEKGYLGLRYGQCHLFFSGRALDVFDQLTISLIARLEEVTDLCFGTNLIRRNA